MYIILNLFTLDLYYEMKKRYYLIIWELEDGNERESFGGSGGGSFQRTDSHTENILVKDIDFQQQNEEKQDLGEYYYCYYS